LLNIFKLGIPTGRSFTLSSTRQQNITSFLVLLPRTEEEESPTSRLRQQQVFWHRCRGKRRLLQGEFRTHILYFVLSFAFNLFLLVSFYQKHKKISILFSCYFFTLVHYVVP
jgi:hypothetical protein